MQLNLVAYTQYRENYGAPYGHEGPWKCKGGDVYRLITMCHQEAAALAQRGLLEPLARHMARVRGVDYRNEASEQTMVGWELLSDEEFQVAREGY